MCSQIRAKAFSRIFVFKAEVFQEIANLNEFLVNSFRIPFRKAKTNLFSHEIFSHFSFLPPFDKIRPPHEEDFLRLSHLLRKRLH